MATSSLGDTLSKRLRLLGITDITIENIRTFRPTFDRNIDVIIHNFYEHMTSFPDAMAIFLRGHDLSSLKRYQKAHWEKLFGCNFNEDYLNSAIKIGMIHYKHKVPPYLYIAGYNFFHCEIIRFCSIDYKGLDLPNALSSITRIISLDMELALSSYTKMEWTHQSK